jgi:hypothetical protein
MMWVSIANHSIQNPFSSECSQAGTFHLMLNGDASSRPASCSCHQSDFSSKGLIHKNFLVVEIDDWQPNNSPIKHDRAIDFSGSKQF